MDRPIRPSPQAAADVWESTPASRLMPRMRGVRYSPTVGEYARLREEALDLLSSPFAQRLRRKRRFRAGARAPPTYQEVMHELRTRGTLRALTQGILHKLRASQTSTLGPGFEHLEQVRPQSLAALDPAERRLVANGRGDPPGCMLDVDANVFNSVSRALGCSQREDGSIDLEQLRAQLGRPLAEQLLAEAEGGWDMRTQAERHWMTAREPFDPDDRPLTEDEWRRLQRVAPELAEALYAAAPIPAALPVLDDVASLHPACLDSVNVVMVQHFLGSLACLVEKLVDLGARPEDMQLVPVSYSTSPLVQERVKRLGATVHKAFSERTLAPNDVERNLERDVLCALEQALNRHRENGKALLVVDDGGMVSRLLAGKAKYLGESADLADRHQVLCRALANVPIRMVEQTTRGITELQQIEVLPPNVTVVNMAQSEAKAFADRFIGPVVVQSLEKALLDMAEGPLYGKRVCVIGFGVIGRWIAECLRHRGARVTVTDADASTLREAEEAGFIVQASLRQSLAEQDVVVGCTGHTSVGKDDFCAASRGTVFVSATSKAQEFFTLHLRAQRSSEIFPAPTRGEHGEAPVVQAENPSIHQAHQVVQWDPEDAFNQAVYYLLNGGCPINFDGEVNCVDPEDIQVTEAIKLEAIMQAMGEPVGRGLLRMDLERQDRVLLAADRRCPGWR